MKGWLAVAIAAVIVAGCASVDAVRDAKGQGVKRVFRQSAEAVYAATLTVIAKRKLEIVEQDRAAGRLVLTNGASWSSLGEHIAVFVNPTKDRVTSVEIVSKPVLSATFPPDWPALLFGDIEEELAGLKKPR
jgi:predicted transcriptional regulator